MASCHRSFIKNKEGRKKGKNKKKWFNLWSLHECLQIEMDNSFCKYHTSDHNNFNFWIVILFHFSCSWNMFKLSLVLGFKFYIFKDLIFWYNQLHLNHKSHVFHPIITMCHTKVLKTLIFFCAWFTINCKFVNFIFSFNKCIKILVAY